MAELGEKPVAVAIPVATGTTATRENAGLMPHEPRQDPFSASRGPNKWESATFDCLACKTKGACTPMCIVNCITCCDSCVYASAVAKSGVDPFDSKMEENMRCYGVIGGIHCELFPFQSLVVRTLIRLAIARKYGIEESLEHAVLLECCCPCCSGAQVTHEIMEKEQLAVGGMKTVPEGGGAPPTHEMER